jgi:hypothetical protein
MASATVPAAPVGGPAEYRQMKAWAQHGGTLPALTLGALTSGSKVWAGTTSYQRTIATPVDSGGHTWSQVQVVTNGDWRAALWVTDNTSTAAGVTFTPGIPSGSDYCSYFFVEALGNLLDVGIEVIATGDGIGPACDTVADGLVLGYIHTPVPSTRLQITVPPETNYHLNEAADGGGTATPWTFGHDTTANAAGVTETFTVTDWAGDYYSSVLWTLAPT